MSFSEEICCFSLLFCLNVGLLNNGNLFCFIGSVIDLSLVSRRSVMKVHTVLSRLFLFASLFSSPDHQVCLEFLILVDPYCNLRMDSVLVSRCS